MTIKRVLVPLSSEVNLECALSSGLLIAQEFNAHLDAVFYKFPLGGHLPFESAEGLSGAVIDERINEQDDIALQCRQHFESALEQRKIDQLDAPLPASRPSAAWRVVDETPYFGVVQAGGGYDLIVIGRHKLNPQRTPRELLEPALFQSGRPVLVAPPNTPRSTGSVVLAAWNRSAQSARAVSAAAPFFELAQKVIVFAVTTGAKRGPEAGEIGRYLDWHQIRNEVVEIPPDHRPVGEAILDEAKERGADLIVMGVYSHSRLRELLLGGVTKYILEHADLPVLMMR
ncbi:MAG: universal stress protein [Alphaproteobacteria bacterium]|nr:universal stress protein [Alphaproteobacteria bacterium]